MKTFSFLSQSITSALGWTLLHSIWQGFAIVLVVAVVLYLLRHRPSYARYWVGIGMLSTQVVISIATFVFYYEPSVIPLATTKMGISAQYLASGMAYTKVTLPWYKEVLLFLQIHLDSVVLFWGMGASVLLIRLVGSWVYVQQLRADGIQLTETRVQTLFRNISAALHIHQAVHLFESARVSTPMVIGFIKPVVLLPVGLVTGLSTKQIEAILAHELAHVRRYDYLTNLLQSLVEVVYFFHPALWWLSGRVRAEREHCCDDMAIKICGDKLAFAQALSEVAAYGQTPQLAMAFTSQKGALLHRVRRVLGVSAPSSTNSGHLSGVLLAILLTLGMSVYAVQQEEKPKQPKVRNVSHTSGNTKIVLDDNGKLSKITWGKRQLSQKEVAKLQQLKQQLEEGEITLQSIKNPEQKAILARLTEVETGIYDGMNALAKGLSNIDFASIIPSENELEAIVAKAEADAADAQPMVDAVMAALSDTLNEKKIAFHSLKIDSLSRLMEPQHQKMEQLHREMQQYEFKISELERKMEVIDWKRNKFHDTRNQLLDKRNRIMYQEEQKAKKTEAEIEKELVQFEEQIKQQETQIEQFNKQADELRQQLKTARQPVEELEKQVRKLEEMNDKYSKQMDMHSQELSHSFPPPPPPAPRASVMRVPRVARAPRAIAMPREIRAPRPATAPKPAAAPSKK